MNVDSENHCTHSQSLTYPNETISRIAEITTSFCDEIPSQKNELLKNLSYKYNFFRNLIIVIDFTEKFKTNDYKPNRYLFLYEKLEYLINNYFKYNLISTISVITMKNYIASLTSPFSNDPSKIIENLKKDSTPEGYPSIYNALNVYEFLQRLQLNIFQYKISFIMILSFFTHLLIHSIEEM
jgi:hypothetical protein